MENEIRTSWLTHAIVKAFSKPTKASEVDDDDEIIDTTKPGFTETFKGLSNTAQRPQRATSRNTEIKRG